MSRVYDLADLASDGADTHCRVPTIEGYAALKLKAWVDRSSYGNVKDASDVGLVLYWCVQLIPLQERLWTKDIDLLVDAEYDAELAAVSALGRDIRSAIGPEFSRRLSELWTAESRTRMSTYLASSVPQLRSLGDADRRRALMQAVVDRL
ncbi:MAG TPA: hypothetical protein VNT53_05930 [Pseudolysinimonas sp.]|nr:hypothetical protein [Pseudolysinimonas sp.]